jgi:hypothetical protein
VSVRIEARPGELARLLAASTSLDTDTDEVGVEVSDGGLVVHIDCAAAAAGDRIAAELRLAGWPITSINVPVGCVGNLLSANVELSQKSRKKGL